MVSREDEYFSFFFFACCFQFHFFFFFLEPSFIPVLRFLLLLFFYIYKERIYCRCVCTVYIYIYTVYIYIHIHTHTHSIYAYIILNASKSFPSNCPLRLNCLFSVMAHKKITKTESKYSMSDSVLLPFFSFPI